MKRQPRTPSKPFESAATKLLKEWMRLRQWTPTDLARELRCSPQLAKALSEGWIDPRMRHAVRLREIARIPLGAWGRLTKRIAA